MVYLDPTGSYAAVERIAREKARWLVRSGSPHPAGGNGADQDLRARPGDSGRRFTKRVIVEKHRQEVLWCRSTCCFWPGPDGSGRPLVCARARTETDSTHVSLFLKKRAPCAQFGVSWLVYLGFWCDAHWKTVVRHCAPRGATPWFACFPRQRPERPPRRACVQF